MKCICKFDRQINGMVTNVQSIFIFLTLVAGLVGTPILFGGGSSSVFAADKKFDVDVDIDQDPIKRGDTQDITVTVKNDDTGRKVSGANVKLTVYPPHSDSTSARDNTDSDGEAKFKVKINSDAETGEYDVKVRVSKDGYNTKTVNTSFEVIKNHHHDNDDNDNNVSSGSSAAAASAASGSAASSAASGSSSAASAASNSAAAAAAAASGSSAASSAAAGGSAVVAVAD